MVSRDLLRSRSLPQAGVLDLSAVELFGVEAAEADGNRAENGIHVKAQIDTKGAVAALKSFWQDWPSTKSVVFMQPSLQARKWNLKKKGPTLR